MTNLVFVCVHVGLSAWQHLWRVMFSSCVVRVNCSDSVTQKPINVLWANCKEVINAPCNATSESPAQAHYEIWKYCQSTTKCQPKVLRNLIVRHTLAWLCGSPWLWACGWASLAVRTAHADFACMALLPHMMVP